MGMSRRVRSTAVFFLAFALLIESPCLFAGDQKHNRASLSGVKEFYVVVEKIAPEIERDGLTEGLIRRDMEWRLQKAGLQTIPEAEAFDVSGSPYLYVNVYVLKLSATKEYIYSINMAFKQDVYLAREPVMVLGASTWSTGETMGITGNLQKIRASIGAQLEQFIAAFFDANPK